MFNRLLKMWNRSSKTIKIAVLVVLTIIVHFLFFRQSVGMENFGNPATLTYYYMENCGHCKRFNPEWDTFVQNYTGPVRLRKVEMNEAGSDLEKYNINGFPTVIAVDENGDKKDYDGPRTSEGLTNFLDNM
jgi:thioredoxin-like negative regulator of GroEL